MVPQMEAKQIVSQQSLKDRRFALERYREYLALQPRPQNLDAVKATVRDLEAELASPRPAPTNALILAPTNPGRPATTARQPAATMVGEPFFWRTRASGFAITSRSSRCFCSRSAFVE